MQNTLPESNENNFVSFLNFIVDPTVIADEKGRILLVNTAFEDSARLSAKEVVGQVFLELSILPAESKAIMLENLKKRMQGLPIQPYEIPFKGKNGELRYTELKAKRISYAGHPAVLVTFRDITQRKKNLAKLKEYAEKMEVLVDEKVREIKENAEKLGSIFDSSPDAIVLVDLNGNTIVECNQATVNMLGCTSREELIDKNCLEFLAKRDVERAIENLKETVKQGRIRNIEYAFIRKDGHEFPAELSASVIKDSFGNPSGLAVIAVDITERKKMEAVVKQRLDMLEALTQNLGVGFTIITKDYRVLWANKFVTNNVGEVEGKHCYASLNTLDHICPDCGVKKVFEDGVARDSHEYTNIGINGNPYYVELIATPLKDKDGNVTAALEFVIDIAEKKQMQSKVTEYSQKLEKIVDKRTEQLKETQNKLLKAEKLAAIGELAAMIGHDLRNPLTGIKGAAYYLKTKCADDIGAYGKEMLKTIDKAIAHSNKIVNDLLEYSSNLRLDLTETTPKSLLKSTLSIIEVPERIQIIDATKNKPKIKADIGSINKVFVNIITNAIDAMSGAGTLTITSETAKDNVEIAFKDTGTGMTEETLGKLKLGLPLFTTKAKGMGFGLPICKRIIEAHGGKLSLESALGKGTTVTVTIPVNPKPVDEGEQDWIFSESTLQAMRASRKMPRKP